MKVLFIARYRDATMTRKLDLLSEEKDIQLRYVCPMLWQDDLIRVDQRACPPGEYERLALGMIGRPSDPHRALYSTFTFALRDFRPDLIHAEEEPDSLAALQIAAARRLWAPNAKLVLYSWQNVNRPKKPWVRRVMRTTFGAADAVLCASEEALQVLWDNGYERSAAVIPAIGVDTRVFRPLRIAGTSSQAFTAGYAGRLVVEKGIELLIEAAGRLGPSMQVTIVGDGPHRGELERLIQRRGLTGRVRLERAAPPAEIARRMNELDALVLPSRTTPVWKEQFGRVLVEAMACGVPVVGSSSGAIPEVIADAGLVFPEGDADALAERLGRLMASPALRRDLAERGRQRVAQLYTQERVAEETAELWRAILGGAPGR